MKTSVQIVGKVVLILLFIFCTPFMEGIRSVVINEELSNYLVYTNPDIEKVDIQSNLNVMSVPKTSQPLQVLEPVEEVVPPIEEVNPSVPTHQGKIYIYNTHQEEQYIGGMSVYNAALILADKLRAQGYDVLVEEGDFIQYGKENDLDYNSSYQISRKFLTDAIMEQGGFDLMIDFHRDSLPRKSTFINVDGVDYAKLMVVIGGLGDHVYEISKRASTLFDKTNALVHGIMKNTMTREAYYNQDMSDKMMLIEVGSDNNTFEEVTRSVEILALAIGEMLG